MRLEKLIESFCRDASKHAFNSLSYVNHPWSEYCRLSQTLQWKHWQIRTVGMTNGLIKAHIWTAAITVYLTITTFRLNSSQPCTSPRIVADFYRNTTQRERERQGDRFTPQQQQQQFPLRFVTIMLPAIVPLFLLFAQITASLPTDGFNETADCINLYDLPDQTIMRGFGELRQVNKVPLKKKDPKSNTEFHRNFQMVHNLFDSN